MNNKNYVEVRPNVNFESIGSKHLQDIQRIEQEAESLNFRDMQTTAVKERLDKLKSRGSEPEICQQTQPNQVSTPKPQSTHEQLDEYQKLFQITQQLTKEKVQLLATIEQLKLKVSEQDKELSKQSALGKVYYKENSDTKDRMLNYEGNIAALELKVEQQNRQLAGMVDLQQQCNWIKELHQLLVNFVQEQKLRELQEQIQSEDYIVVNQIIIEYLMNSFVLRINQEQKYEQHIRDNIQIIFDLQNKIQDLTHPTSSPKGSHYQNDTIKMTFDSVNAHQTQQKIKYLKQQGKTINKNWQLFCENILRERNECQQQQRSIIDSLNEQLISLQQTINQILQYVSPKQQQLWIDVLENKQRIHQCMLLYNQLDSSNVEREGVESELKILYQKLAYTQQKISSDQDGLVKSDVKRALQLRDMEIQRLRMQIAKLEAAFE